MYFGDSLRRLVILFLMLSIRGSHDGESSLCPCEDSYGCDDGRHNSHNEGDDDHRECLNSAYEDHIFQVKGDSY